VLAGQSDGTRPYVDQSRGLTPELPAPRQARALPGVVQTCAAAVCLVLVLVGPGLHVLNAALGARPVYPWFATDASGSIAYFAVGGLIVSRRLENPIGWLLCAVGLLASLDLASSEYAITSQLGTHGLPPGSQWAEWLSTWVWVAESFPPVFLLLLFPDGRLPAGRMFRATAVLLAIGAGVAVVIMATQPGPMSATPGVIDLMNPLGILVPNSAREPLLMMCFWLWFAGTLLSILVLVDRYIGSRDIQRQQIKWIALGAAITTPVLLAINYPLYDLIRANVTGQIVVCIAQAVFPVTVGVAIFRYRLYSIDLIINRAAVYTILTFVLGSGFLAVTALSQKALQLTTGQQSDVVPVALGIGTAFVFQPARRRAQFLVDRVLPAREQRALFFTDIVGSTEHLARIGDGAWRDLLERYRAVVRRELKRHGGAEMHIAGDSFFATFSDPLRAVRCAQSLAPALRTLGLESRFGVHWGPCEVRGEEVSGLSVWAAARVMSAAGPSEIMISEPVLEALGPKQVPVEDRGTHQLKGLPGDWHLHALAEQASGATS
jgi:class 3 adenylate cyclase